MREKTRGQVDKRRTQQYTVCSMDVLLVYEDCRREVTLVNNSLKSIEAQFKKINPNIELEPEGGYVLQRFSQKWDTFVDVTESSQVHKGDKLTVLEKQPKKVG